MFMRVCTRCSTPMTMSAVASEAQPSRLVWTCSRCGMTSAQEVPTGLMTEATGRVVRTGQLTGTLLGMFYWSVLAEMLWLSLSAAVGGGVWLIARSPLAGCAVTLALVTGFTVARMLLLPWRVRRFGGLLGELIKATTLPPPSTRG